MILPEVLVAALGVLVADVALVAIVALVAVVLAMLVLLLVMMYELGWCGSAVAEVTCGNEFSGEFSPTFLFFSLSFFSLIGGGAGGVVGQFS